MDIQILKQTKGGWALWFLKSYDGRYRLMLKTPSRYEGKEIFGFGGKNEGT